LILNKSIHVIQPQIWPKLENLM